MNISSKTLKTISPEVMRFYTWFFVICTSFKNSNSSQFFLHLLVNCKTTLPTPGSSPKSKEWLTLKVRRLSKLMHLTFKFIKLQEKKISMLFYFRKYKNSCGAPQIHFTFDKTVFPQDPFSGSSGSFSDIAWSLSAAGKLQKLFNSSVWDLGCCLN